MAATAVQITANRKNAQHSTGPRTEAGKRASSKNSLATGLTSAQIFVRPGEESAFAEFQSDLLGEMKPEGTTQNHHFTLILHAAWNLRRCLILEGEIQNEAIAKGIDALLDDELAKKLDRIYRYKKMHESTHRQATAELRRLQTEQLWRQENQGLADESILTDTRVILSRLRKDKGVEERTNLDVLRQRIETAFITPASEIPKLFK